MADDDSLVQYLKNLKYEDSGTLAAFRRACGQSLGQSPNCYDFKSIGTHPADFLAVTLVAQYPTSSIRAGKHHFDYGHHRSVGAAWARYCRERDVAQDPARFYKVRQEAIAAGRSPARPPSIHERFRTTLDAELECDGTGELAHRLRGLIRMLVAAEVPIDTTQLAIDLRSWRSEKRFVQERWAKAFYAPPNFDRMDSANIVVMTELDTNGDQEPRFNEEENYAD